MLGIYPCKGRASNAQGSRPAKGYQCSRYDRGRRARKSNFGPKYDSVESGEGRSGGSETSTNSAHSVGTPKTTISNTMTIVTQLAWTVSTGRDSTSPDLFHALPKCALSTSGPQPASVHNSIHQPTSHSHSSRAYDDPTDIPRLYGCGVHTLYHDDSAKPSVQSE